ncbi:MAG: hypothetical protein VX000_04290, partial [Myxococcota bacterium]|nr:hypothetical protein [Myxococcota bacterium]
MSSLSSKVARSLGAGLTAAGIARLDAHELSFSTSGLLGPLMRSKSFRVALDDIASLSWSTRSSTLRIEMDAGPPFILQGTGGVRLLVAMSAMNVGRRQREGDARVGRLHTESAATLAAGPVYYRGHLALGSGGLFWECTGPVEQLVGIAGIRLPLEAIVGARVESTGMTLLATDGAEHRLLLDRPAPLIHAMFELVREHAPDRAAGIARGEGAEDAEPSVVCFGATLHELDSSLTAQGSVSARADGTLHAAWLGGEPRVIEPVHVQRLAYGEPDPDAAPEMVLTTTVGTQLRITPSDGWAPIEALFALSRSLPLLSMVPPAQHPLLSRAVGELASVTSDTARVERLALRPAVLLHLADAVGVVLPGRVEWKVAVGTRVRLQIGLPRALLMISGRFMGCAHRSRAEGLPGWPAGTESAHV